MPQLSFTVVGDKQLSRNIRAFVDRLDNLGEFFRDAIDIVEARTDDLFSKEGSNVEKAGRWPPLAASTIEARTRRWGYYKKSPNKPGVLRWTGNLQENRNKNINDAFGELTFRAPYAIHHQKPGTPGRPPQRVVIDLSNSTNTEIVRALQTKIHKDIGMFGLQA